ncbi:ras GTPase-activating-like protein IQGAP3 [Morone saxatilis]|uniref:ras GTPase-activating-like protein IQGAP3 n=1 Tax=Morone saxatilis TaxID=34816 RepID=UPI0015E1D35C|nr:ras GTPase-activating-like protein IQGAP3 [Morone saxatilis]
MGPEGLTPGGDTQGDCCVVKFDCGEVARREFGSSGGGGDCGFEKVAVTAGEKAAWISWRLFLDGHRVRPGKAFEAAGRRKETRALACLILPQAGHRVNQGAAGGVKGGCSLLLQGAMKVQGGWLRMAVVEVVSSVSGSYTRSVLWQSSEALVVRLQAVCRGFLLRQKLEARRRYLITHTPAVVIIQAHWRRFVQQRSYRRRLQLLYMNWRAAVKIQSLVKMWLARRKYRARLSFFRRHVGAVIKIQAFFRANRAREQYRMLVHSAMPPLSVVRKFVHLLDLGDGDIKEEAELLRQREEVVRSIRFNRQLEADLHLMDLKIGLLVRNRATLQEVVSHCKKLTKKNKEQLSDMMDVERSKGLKALSRERRERLEAYQHLFYLLQPNVWNIDNNGGSKKSDAEQQFTTCKTYSSLWR